MKIFYKSLKIIVSTILLGILLTSCKDGKLIGGDARKFPDDPKLRVKKNLEEGRGFRLSDSTKILGGSGTFDFASSNELWRASLDVIDFMPLSSVNYSGGIIITDWYSDGEVSNESIKISIRFLTNEIRSDALNIKVFTRKCETSLINCKYLDSNNVLVKELKKEILKKAALYKKQNLKKPKKNNMWSSKPKED